MSTIVGEYLIRCPSCGSGTRLVAEMQSPIMVYCPGCDQSIIINGSIIFTVPFDYAHSLYEKYKIRICGRILASEISKKAKSLISKDKIDNLHDLLKEPLDVNDFIKKLQ